MGWPSAGKVLKRKHHRHTAPFNRGSWSREGRNHVIRSEWRDHASTCDTLTTLVRTSQRHPPKRGALNRANIYPLELLWRHARGDGGDVPREDAVANALAL